MALDYTDADVFVEASIVPNNRTEQTSQIYPNLSFWMGKPNGLAPLFSETPTCCGNCCLHPIIITYHYHHFIVSIVAPLLYSCKKKHPGLVPV